MPRTLTIAGCLLAPASAGATTIPNTRDLPRGYVVLGYSGTATRTIPTATYCQGTNPCIDYGQDRVEGNWDATVIFDRTGVARDTLLRAYVDHHNDPNYENPTSTPSPYPPCENKVYDRNHRYAKGAFMTPTARSLGFEMSLPIDSQWMQTLDETDPKNCGWGGDYTGVGVFGAASYGPTDPAEIKQLGLAGERRGGMRKSTPSTTKHFDFEFSGAPAASGSGSLTTITITSKVTVINGCRRVYLPTHRCLERD
jgi:hypothetical protein